MININKEIVLSYLMKFQKRTMVRAKMKKDNHVKTPVPVHFNDQDFCCL